MTYLFAAKAGCRPGQSEAVYCQMTTTLGIGRKSHNPHVRLIGCEWQPSLFRTSISIFHKSNPSDRSFHVIQFNNRIPRKFPSTMKKQVVKRERIRQRPVEVAVDYLVSGDSDFVQREFAFLSKDLEKEFQEADYIAVASPISRSRGWRVFKVGKWEGQPVLEGRKVVISGVDNDFRKQHLGHVLIQPVTPPPLETVVLKISELDYDILAEDQGAFGRLQNEGVVMRPGRILEVNGFRVDVTLCEPVRQGLLGNDTEIILVTDAEEKRALADGIGTPFSMTSQNESELDIIQFLSLPSSEDDLESTTEVAETSSLTPPEDDAASRGIPLRVVVLQHPVDKYSLDPRPSDSEDPEFRVYAHMRDIARIGVFSGDWVKCSFLITNNRFRYNRNLTPLLHDLSAYMPPRSVNQAKSTFHRFFSRIYPNQSP